MGIAIYLNDVYWVDRNLMTVFKASKLNANESAVRVRTNLEKLRDIAIFNINNQPQDDANPCAHLGNGGCDQLCFSFPRRVGPLVLRAGTSAATAPPAS